MLKPDEKTLKEFEEERKKQKRKIDKELVKKAKEAIKTKI